MGTVRLDLVHAHYTKMDNLSERAYQVFGPRKQGKQTVHQSRRLPQPIEMDANLFNGGYHK